MKLSDCAFLVGAEHNRKTVRAHKLILSMASPVFETMFFGSLAEKEYPIVIPDVEPETFRTLLEYIYTDRLNLGSSFDNATALCYVAQKYMLPHIVEDCIKYVKSNLNPKNACRGYEFAKFFDKPELMLASMELIENNTSEVLADPEFIDIEITTLMEIMGKDNLHITSELELFNSLERYAAAKGSPTAVCEDNSKGEESLLRQAVKKIRFLRMTPKEFAESAASSKLLYHHEKFAILMNISSGNIKDCPMPEGFCTLNSSRKCRPKLNGRSVHRRGTNLSFKQYENSYISIFDS